MTNRDDILIKEAGLGRASLTSDERKVYLIYRTVSELENGGLSGLLYNISQDWDYLTELSIQLRQNDEIALARQFEQAESICRSAPEGYSGTWGGWLAIADPEKRLEGIANDLQVEMSRMWHLLEACERET